jgi:hypothetical protein
MDDDQAGIGWDIDFFFSAFPAVQVFERKIPFGPFPSPESIAPGDGWNLRFGFQNHLAVFGPGKDECRGTILEDEFDLFFLEAPVDGQDDGSHLGGGPDEDHEFEAVLGENPEAIPFLDSGSLQAGGDLVALLLEISMGQAGILKHQAVLMGVNPGVAIDEVIDGEIIETHIFYLLLMDW